MGARGRFVAFEGADGTGKSTQLRRLAERLRGAGRRVVETREPGGSPGAEAIRALLVSGETGRWSAETELLLFNAARRDHVERVIRPALDRDEDVLCDRFVDSTRAYQAAGRGADPALVELLHERLIGLDPDVTVILDLDPAEAAARVGAQGGDERRFEGFGPAFQSRLREAYRALAADAPERRALVDAAGAAEDVAARVAGAVLPRLGRAA